MKKNWTFRFMVLILILTLITTSLVADTYSKYTTVVNGADIITVAKWQADFEEVGTTTSTFTTNFDLIGTLSDTGVNGNLLAPGTSGLFSLDYDTSESQVARNVTITMNVGNLLETLTYLKFYSDSTMTTEFSYISANSIELMNTDFAADALGEGTLDVFWAWPFETIDGDSTDTIDGIAAESFDINIVFTATQLDE